LSDQPIEVFIVGSLNAQVSSTDVVYCLVVDHEAAIGVLKGGVSGKNRVVGLDDRGGDLRSWIDAELELALLAIVDRQAFHEQSSKTRPCATAEGVEDQEALKTRAIVRNAANLVKNLINELFTDCVMTTGIVVGRIFLSGDHHFWVEKTAVGAGADFIDDIGLEIAVDGSRDVFAIALDELQSVRVLGGEEWGRYVLTGF
jgi:hypothetical protein